jgi:hypothetical protein
MLALSFNGLVNEEASSFITAAAGAPPRRLRRAKIFPFFPALLH